MPRLVASVLDGRYEGRSGSEVDCADHYYGQTRLQVCTLTSTNVIIGRMDSAQARMESAQTETTALLQQVLTMIQQGSVRQRSRSLSIHSQVEPAGFNSETTRVRHHPRFGVILMGTILRSWPIQPHPLSPSLYCHLMPLFHMIVSSFA